MIVRRYPKDVIATVSTEYEQINLRRCLLAAQAKYIADYGEVAGSNFAQVGDWLRALDEVKDA